MTKQERREIVVSNYKRNLQDERFTDRFINWLFDKGYIEEFENILESERVELNSRWLYEKEHLESQGAGDAAEAAWERVNR